jgi:hypothetical protein
MSYYTVFGMEPENVDAALHPVVWHEFFARPHGVNGVEATGKPLHFFSAVLKTAKGEELLR